MLFHSALTLESFFFFFLQFFNRSHWVQPFSHREHLHLRTHATIPCMCSYFICWQKSHERLTFMNKSRLEKWRRKSPSATWRVSFDLTSLSNSWSLSMIRIRVSFLSRESNRFVKFQILLKKVEAPNSVGGTIRFSRAGGWAVVALGALDCSPLCGTWISASSYGNPFWGIRSMFFCFGLRLHKKSC